MNYENEDFVDPVQPFLTTADRKKCCEYMRQHPNKIPVPATEKEIETILNWLNTTKKNNPNYSTHQYKDAFFNKMGDVIELKLPLDGNDGKWVLSHKNPDYIWLELLGQA